VFAADWANNLELMWENPQTSASSGGSPTALA
jgi:hypothetical protein